MRTPRKRLIEYCSSRHPSFRVTPFFTEEPHDEYIIAASAELRGRRASRADVLRIVQRVGLTALRPDRWERELEAGELKEFHPHLRELRELVWDALEHWHLELLDSPSERTRTLAGEYLDAALIAAFPRPHGRRRRADPYRVFLTYKRVQNAVARARDLETVWPWQTKSPEDKLRRVAEACGLPFGNKRVLHSYFGPEGVNQTAYRLTGSQYDLSAERVTNIVSELNPKRTSRKSHRIT